jgi:gas vesicle protein
MLKSNKDQKQETVKKIAIGAAITGLIGYLVGILTAPKSGKETREDIKDKAFETYSVAEKELKKLHTELVDLIDEATDRVSEFRNRKDVKDALDRGNDARQKAREVLSTLHDGEANDKDLKRAISDATKAIEHLRDFLRK